MYHVALHVGGLIMYIILLHVLYSGYGYRIQNHYYKCQSDYAQIP